MLKYLVFATLLAYASADDPEPADKAIAFDNQAFVQRVPDPPLVRPAPVYPGYPYPYGGGYGGFGGFGGYGGGGYGGFGGYRGGFGGYGGFGFPGWGGLPYY